MIDCNSRWVRNFFNLAQLVGSWSKDPSTKVGAVIVDEETRIIRGLGYNGFPRGVRDDEERLSDRVQKYPLTVHAEANAILNANGSVRGCSIFVTQYPCAECAKLIVQAGIHSVWYIEPSKEFATRWQEQMQYADLILFEGGVQTIGIEADRAS